MLSVRSAIWHRVITLANSLEFGMTRLHRHSGKPETASSFRKPRRGYPESLERRPLVLSYIPSLNRFRLFGRNDESNRFRLFGRNDACSRFRLCDRNDDSSGNWGRFQVLGNYNFVDLRFWEKLFRVIHVHARSQKQIKQVGIYVLVLFHKTHYFYRLTE